MTTQSIVPRAATDAVSSADEPGPMALSESALSDLLASLQAGEGIDLVRELARWALQELIEAEATAAIGAGRYERTEGRVTERNGHRPRVLSTKAGDLAVGDPEAARRVVLPVAARSRAGASTRPCTRW